MFDFKGKNAVVFGGMGGIGLESCKLFLSKGVANLAIADLQENANSLKMLSNQYPNVGLIYIKLDITKVNEIQECFKKIIEKFKKIDVFLNACGIIADNDVRLTMDVNLLGIINAAYMVYEYMSKLKGGSGGMIVNIASVLGLEPSPPIPVYSASKYGVLGFTRSLADDFYYSRTGVSMVTICPGLTDTNLLKLDGKLALDCAKPLGDEFLAFKRQTAADCAKNLVKAIEMNKNGSIWICDKGTLREVKPTNYWLPEKQ